jgi:hypothetical protein
LNCGFGPKRKKTTMTATISRSAPGTVLPDSSVSPEKKKTARLHSKFERSVHNDAHPDPYDRVSRSVMTKSELAESVHLQNRPDRPFSPAGSL